MSTGRMTNGGNMLAVTSRAGLPVVCFQAAAPYRRLAFCLKKAKGSEEAPLWCILFKKAGFVAAKETALRRPACRP